MWKIRTLPWLDSIKSWSGRTALNLVFSLWISVLRDPSRTCCSADDFDLLIVHALGIIIVDLDLKMMEGAPPVHGFAINGCRIKTTQIQQFGGRGLESQRWPPI